MFSGIWIPLVTPFHHGQVDTAALRRLVRHYQGAGVSGFVALGTTGEAALLSQIEPAVGLQRQIGLAVLIETAIGMVNVDEIARACPERMEAMIFGVADYAASVQARTTSIGAVSESASASVTSRPMRSASRYPVSSKTPRPAASTRDSRSHTTNPVSGAG